MATEIPSRSAASAGCQPCLPLSAHNQQLCHNALAAFGGPRPAGPAPGTDITTTFTIMVIITVGEFGGPDHPLTAQDLDAEEAIAPEPGSAARPQ